MNVNLIFPPRPARRGQVVALHCSGAGAGQWRYLAESLGGHCELLAPEHYGCDSVGPWSGEHAFSLADEALRTIALIDRAGDKVHLVGHSYGGGVALHAALARPDRIASMALYEPSAFHLLKQMGRPGAEAHAEIARLVQQVCEGAITGDLRSAAAAFVDYWNGAGAWASLRPAVQQALIRWMPKAPLDFRALLEEPTRASAYRALGFPVLILRGEHARRPSRLLAEGLASLMPASRLMVVDGAGHMGPLTHAPEVSALIVQHVAAAETAAGLHPKERGRNLAEPHKPAAQPLEALS
jgi:pimeloyl-ACP methyl ester carboxylesterase